MQTFEPDPGIEIIPWRDFQIAIAPMWGIAEPSSITILNNPYRVIRIPVMEWPNRILHYPVRFTEDGVVKGYTCVYNVSDTAVRIRGIFVLPEHRGRGAGMRMTKASLSLFPPGFHRLIGFFKETTAQSFIDHCDFRPVPHLDWLWSDYQKVRIRAMTWDRLAPPKDVSENHAFIESQIRRHGLGGTNNLNRSWTDEEWSEFSQPHVEVYPDVGLNVDFR